MWHYPASHFSINSHYCPQALSKIITPMWHYLASNLSIKSHYCPSGIIQPASFTLLPKWHYPAESPLDLFWVQNSGLFLDIKIITFLDFDLKFLIFSGCPRKVGNLVSFAVVSILHIVLICFRDTYF